VGKQSNIREVATITLMAAPTDVTIIDPFAFSHQSPAWCDARMLPQPTRKGLGGLNGQLPFTPRIPNIDLEPLDVFLSPWPVVPARSGRRRRIRCKHYKRVLTFFHMKIGADSVDNWQFAANLRHAPHPNLYIRICRHQLGADCVR